MLRTTVKELYTRDKSDGETVRVSGWIRSVRSNGSLAFVSLNDGSFFSSVQVVIEKERCAAFDEIASLNVGSAITVIGTVVLTPNAKQPFEINVDEAFVEGASSPDYPLQKKRHSNEYLRTILHLRPRTNTFSAVFRVRSVLAHAIHSFFEERGFVYVHTPIITTSDCEGAGEMFRVTTLDMDDLPRTESGKTDFSRDFFGKSTFLTVSGQLNLETHAMALGSVYSFAPAFRAEDSNTPRHAAEFWMVEPEIAFADLEDDERLAEDMLKYIIKYVLDNAKEEMEFFNRFVDTSLLDRLHNIIENDFAKITYTEAVKILSESGEKFEYPVKWGLDLQTEHERYLTERVFVKPLFVTDYPKEIKAFYMRVNDDGKTVAAMDLLVPGVGEIIGGSQREERLDVLLKRMEEMGLDEKDYVWYTDLRRYGSAKHAGFGLGFERAIMYITGMNNIRDVVSFPRTANSAQG